MQSVLPNELPYFNPAQRLFESILSLSTCRLGKAMQVNVSSALILELSKGEGLGYVVSCSPEKVRNTSFREMLRIAHAVDE